MIEKDRDGMYETRVRYGLTNSLVIYGQEKNKDLEGSVIRDTDFTRRMERDR